MEILGVRIDNLEKKEILQKIESFLAGDRMCQIATINPEFILAAQKDVEFRNILNKCDLNVADGAGINFAFWKNGEKLKCRVTGVDLMREILRIASDRGLGVYLVANNDGLSNYQETSEAIKKLHPNIKISGIDLDKKISNFQFPISNKIPNSKYQILDTKYQILFCNFGAPYQEKFIYSLKNENYGKIRLAMGVGGSFDFVTGKVCRAPIWMRKAGLEWLFRLWKQPSRFRRIFRAVVIFPIKVIFNK